MTPIEFVRLRLLAPPPRAPAAFPSILAFVAAPTLLRLALDGLATGIVFVFYYPSVLLAGLLLGWRIAAVVMIIAAALANFLFMEPRYALFAQFGDTLSTALFLLSSALIIAVAEMLRRTAVQVEAGRQREARLYAELQHVNAELQHRVTNILTVVQGLATKTFRGLPDSHEAVHAFEGRLQALAEAQDLLTSGAWELCQLPDLAVRALAPFNGEGAMELAGPACTLPKEACVPLVLALHELATNAVKYGALSNLSGSVTATWSLIPAASGETGDLVLEWTEAGGPSVEPPTRRGLGSRLLSPQRGLDEVALDFRPDGLRCRIVVRGATNGATPPERVRELFPAKAA